MGSIETKSGSSYMKHTMDVNIYFSNLKFLKEDTLLNAVQGVLLFSLQGGNAKI